MTDRVFDIIVFGATSFVGRILSQYLAKYGASNEELKWAVAGRQPTAMDLD